MAVEESLLERKFDTLSNSQENVQSLSLWLIHHRNHHKKIVDTWFKVLTRSSVSHRLTLLYLANDVIQNAKKKGITAYVDSFEPMLRRCMNLLSDEKIRANVARVLDIWSDRGIYKSHLIQELKSGLSYSETVSDESSFTTQIMAEFKLCDVADAVDQMKNAEQATVTAIEEVKGAKLAALNNEILNRLKDKTAGDHLIREADDASRLIQEAIDALDQEQRHRKALIENLTKALIYYVTQNSEVDQEFKAYVRIGQNAAKVLTLLTSPRSKLYPPLPTDVPSPTNSDDGPILPPDSEEQKKHTSSLDQRLETILCGMKGSSTSNMAQVPKHVQPSISYPYQVAAISDQDCRIPPNAAPSSLTNIPLPPEDRMRAQPIQSLVSARPAISTLQPGTGIAFGSGEDCEPADMDITNSDDEDSYVPSFRGPNLRVIEPIGGANTSFESGLRSHQPTSMQTVKSNLREPHDTSAWHRITGGSGRFSPRSSTVPIGSRWNTGPGRSRHNDNGRQAGRRSGSFRNS